MIMDWGGVLTSPIPDSVRSWLDADGIDHDSYVSVIRPWLHAAYTGDGEGNPVHALERGECTPEEFERLLASQIVPTAAAYLRRAAEAFTSELNMLRCLRMHRIC